MNVLALTAVVPLLLVPVALGAETSPAAPRERAVRGFYGVERRANGDWWVVDPEGRDTFILGVDHVRYEGHWCEKLNGFPHLAEMKRKFPDKEDWRRETIGRLREWGFNLLGAGSNEDLKHRGLAHTVFLSMGDTWAGDPDEDKWICPDEHHPCSAFPNVFHPDWPAHCAEIARQRCTPEKDDPLLFGYFIDNELAWWGRSEEWGLSATGLFDEAMKRGEKHPARLAALALAAERGVKPGEPVPDDVKLEFLRRAAERYFASACAAIRSVDPNHLVLGARFAGLGGANPEVWRVAGRYCDLVTFNCYPWADLDRDLVLSDVYTRRDSVYDAFKRTYDLTGRPLLITEWSFPALDSGLPCRNGAGQRFRTQAERTEASELFAKAMLAMPFVIGYDYFMWVDEPALGISTAFPEDSNYGLVNNEGVPYPGITEMFRRLHADPARARKGVVAVGADGYSLGSAEGPLFRGACGEGPIFQEVSFRGSRYGRFNVMLAIREGDRIDWRETGWVRSAERKGTELAVVAAGKGIGSPFEVRLRFTSPDAEGRVVAEAVEVRNLGSAPLVIDHLLFREYPDFGDDVAIDGGVPFLWRGGQSAAWKASDGRVYGARSTSSACRAIRYFRQGDRFFPDAAFNLGDGAVTLQPGEVRALSGIWIQIDLGR